MNSSISEEEAEKIDLIKFDENDAVQHQEKCLIGFGSLFGFRGNSEHTNLNIQQIGNGYFPSNHPRWAGKEWWGLTHIDKDKRHRLGLNNCNVRDVEDDFGRFPVLSDGKIGNVSKDVGGAMKRIMEKIPPSSKPNRFYRRYFLHYSFYGPSNILTNISYFPIT